VTQLSPLRGEGIIARRRASLAAGQCQNSTAKTAFSLQLSGSAESLFHFFTSAQYDQAEKSHGQYSADYANH